MQMRELATHPDLLIGLRELFLRAPKDIYTLSDCMFPEGSRNPSATDWMSRVPEDLRERFALTIKEKPESSLRFYLPGEPNNEPLPDSRALVDAVTIVMHEAAHFRLPPFQDLGPLREVVLT